MTRFYTHLDADMSKAEALRQAQLDLIAKKDIHFIGPGLCFLGIVVRYARPKHLPNQQAPRIIYKIGS